VGTNIDHYYEGAGYFLMVFGNTKVVAELLKQTLGEDRSSAGIYTSHKAQRLMQLHSGAELFRNVIVPYSELTSKYHIGA
jgi:hypothetical protein